MPRLSSTARACDASTLDAPVYFLFSSTPDRAARLPRVLATMREQSLQPAAVVLSISRKYNATRFINSSYTLAPELLRQQPRLLIHTVPRDLGPITKYAGAKYLLTHLQPATAKRAIVIVGDDDMFYGSSFVEDYACAVARGPPNSVFSVWHIHAHAPCAVSVYKAARSPVSANRCC